MKLFEILDVKQINHPKDINISPETDTRDMRNNHFNKVRELKSNKTDSILGSGCEGVIFQSKRAQDIGTVTKWLRNQKTDYIVNKSIQYLIQSQQTNSTFAPKVYSITQYKRPNGLYEYSIRMEKLPFTLTDYVEKFIGNGGDMDDPHIARQLLSQVYVQGIAPPRQIGWSICSKIDDGLDYIQAESTKQSADYIEFMKKVCGERLDIHSGNIMVRLTSVGPQLVVTDPVIDH